MNKIVSYTYGYEASTAQNDMTSVSKETRLSPPSTAPSCLKKKKNSAVVVRRYKVHIGETLVCRDRLKLLHWYPANVLTLCSVSVRRAPKVAMTPSTWLQSPWWPPTAPSGIQPNQSQKNSWSRCSPASSSSAKSRKPLTCLRACTSGTAGEQWTDYTLPLPLHPAFWLLIISSFLFSHTLLWSLRVACICLYSLCVSISYTQRLYIHIQPVQMIICLIEAICQPHHLFFSLFCLAKGCSV